MNKAKIVCLFSRQLGLETLKGIIKDNVFDVKAIVTHYYETDMVTKRELFEEFVKICEENSYPLIVINKNQKNLKILNEIEYDFLVANCYKYIIPENYLGFAKIATLNMHRSLLPKHKGLKPLKRAIESGDKETGTSIHKMVQEIDSGSIIDQWKISIEPGDNEEKLFEKLYPTQYPLMKRALLKLLKKNEK